MKQYTKEWLEELCKNSSSYIEVLEKAGRKYGGGTVQTLKNKIAEYNIDISHFKRQGWNKGLTKDTDSRIKSKERYKLEDIFVENSPITRHCLIDYIRKYNIIEYKCQFCGCDGNWIGDTISLELDHINGINNDNRVENLRFLCPNCHALTDTYRGKNKGKQKEKALVSEEQFVEALKATPNIRQALILLGLTPYGGNYVRANALIEKYNIQKF